MRKYTQIITHNYLNTTIIRNLAFLIVIGVFLVTYPLRDASALVVTFTPCSWGAGTNTTPDGVNCHRTAICDPLDPVESIVATASSTKTCPGYNVYNLVDIGLLVGNIGITVTAQSQLGSAAGSVLDYSYNGGRCDGFPVDLRQGTVTNCPSGSDSNGDTSLVADVRACVPQPPGDPPCPGAWWACTGGWQGCSVCPIVLDVTGNGFDLTDAQGGVLFDFFHTGTPQQISWTASDSTNA